MPTQTKRIRPEDFGLHKIGYALNELPWARTTSYRLIDAGFLKPGKVGSRTIVYAQDLAELLALLQTSKAANVGELLKRTKRGAELSEGAS